MKSIDQQRQLKKYFVKYKIGTTSLISDAVEHVDELSEFIQRKLLIQHYKGNHQASHQHILLYLKLMLDVIKKLNQQLNLSLIVKKIIILYLSVNILSLNNLFTESIQNLLKVEINKVYKEDCYNIFNKKRNSIDKIVGYIREFSLSKQKAQVGTSRPKVEHAPEKGALKEIVVKIIEPFCVYLLKIVQDNAEYRQIKRKGKEQNNEIVWKMINWIKIIGQIITTIFKLSRYLKSDITSTFVLVSCLCSKDIGVFYDYLTIYSEVQAYQWKIKIFQYLQIIQDRDPHHPDPISRDPKFLDLKGHIEQLFVIKEIFLYLFGNKQFKEWSFYFYKPYCLKVKKSTSAMETFQYILNFCKRKEKERKQSDCLKKVDRKSDKYMMLCQTEAVYSKELLKNQSRNDTFIEQLKTQVKSNQIQYTDFPYKEIQHIQKKTRLNWNTQNRNQLGIRKNTRLLVQQLQKSIKK